ncbi:MAG: integrase core domain-containing protein [Firmicutes bacterium]|nr:integrase core domain-containing protein [Bacillota bacterium]
MESWHSLLKKARLYQHPWQTRDKATSAIFSYIEIFYNCQRVHSALGYRTPAACLAAGMSLRAAGAEDGARPCRFPISEGGNPRIFVVEFIDISPPPRIHSPMSVIGRRPFRAGTRRGHGGCATSAGDGVGLGGDPTGCGVRFRELVQAMIP